MLTNIQVKEWMNSPVVTVATGTPISTAHKIMKDNGIRRLVVVNDKGALKGIITIGDIREASPSDASTLSIWELNYLWAQLTVDTVMTKNPITIRPDDAIAHAAKIMLEKKVSGIPVVDEASKLIGVITESDIFRMVVKTFSAVES